MKKTLFLLLTFVNLVFAYNYDDVLIKAQAAIFPKVILLDKKIEDKLVDGKIIYTIVYDKTDYMTAEYIKIFIDKKFKDHLGVYSYEINLVDIEEFSMQTPSSAVYMLNLTKDVEKVANIANAKGVISFSYDINNLQKGLMFSLVIEKSTVLYLTKEKLHSKKVDFVDALLQMVKFVEKSDYALKESTFNYEILAPNIFYISRKH